MTDFNQIYSEHYDKVLAWVTYRTNPEVGEEITQDVFMKVYDNLHNYDENIAKVGTWVMRIANNAIIDHYRKVRLETLSIDGLVNEDGKEYFQASVGGTPVSEIVQREYREALKNCILDLPDTYKRIANLYFNCDMSYDEISDRMRIPLGTVKGKLARARNLLEGSVSIIKSQLS